MWWNNETAHAMNVYLYVILFVYISDNNLENNKLIAAKINKWH